MRLHLFFRHPQLRSRLKSALFFGALGAGVVSIGWVSIYRAWEREHRAFVQQSVGDAAAALAAQAALELERVVATLREVAIERRRVAETPGVPGGGRAADTVGGLSPVPTEMTGTIETIAEIAEVSLWRRGADGAAPVRASLAVNSRSRAATPAWVKQVPQSAEHEAAEAKLLIAAFRGQVVVRGEPPGMAWLAVPLGRGEATEVVSAHLTLERLQGLFAADPAVQAMITDGFGEPLAQTEALSRLDPASRNDLLLALRPFLDQARSGRAESALEWLEGENGLRFFAGFRRIGIGQLAVVAMSLPEIGSESDGSDGALHGARSRLLVFAALIFLGLAAGRFRFLSGATRRGEGKADLSSPDADPSQDEAPDAGSPPRAGVFATVHGSLRGYNQLLDGAGPEEATEALNDYLTWVASRVRACGGHFDTSAGVSFVASWEAEPASATGGGHLPAGVEDAVGCAVSLLEALKQLNASRKLDGRRPLAQGIGVHVGRGILARVGAAGRMRQVVLGEAPACARALDRLGLASGSELVVSHDVLGCVAGTFVGASLGEKRLTDETGLTAYYSIREYRKQARGPGSPPIEHGGELSLSFLPPAPAPARQTSGETRMEILAPSASPSRWLVNNGSQIVGPFTARELAQRLFTQELDFDCECWSEETGKSAQLRTSGAFMGSSAAGDSAGARLWLFDGKDMHGPVTEGFVRTALSRSAIGEHAHVCAGSTVEGWKPVKAFLADVDAAATARTPGGGSGAPAA